MNYPWETKLLFVEDAAFEHDTYQTHTRKEIKLGFNLKGISRSLAKQFTVFVKVNW